MSKDDLQAIKGIVDGSVNQAITESEERIVQQVDGRINQAVAKSEENMSGRIDKAIIGSERRTDKKIDEVAMQSHQLFNDLADTVGERFDKMDAKIDNLASQMDSLIGDYKSLRDEEAANANFNARADDRLDDHEIRIGKLERVVAA